MAWFAPDSPWWFVRKGSLAKAEKSLVRLSSGLSSAEIRFRLALIVHTDNLEKAMKTESRYWDYFRSTNLRRTEIACMVLAAQELSGQAFAYGSTYFFLQAGLNSSDSYKLNLGGTALAFLATCGSWVMMNFLGRRTMIIAGMAGMVIILLIIGVLSYPAVYNNDATWVQAALTLLWLGIYSLTVGPQLFAVAAEISATRVRSQTISIVRNSYNAVQIIANTVEPYLINPTETNLKGKTALVWMALAFLALLWYIFRLPETRGLTYEELDILFEKRVSAWRFKTTKIDLIKEPGSITNKEKDKQ
jgi:MFS transporter, SP family, general alpha glucoside:H+ symporter